MAESMSDEFMTQLVKGYLLIQRERFSDASDHFNRMLYTEHNPNDDDIIVEVHDFRLGPELQEVSSFTHVLQSDILLADSSSDKELQCMDYLFS